MIKINIERGITLYSIPSFYNGGTKYIAYDSLNHISKYHIDYRKIVND